MDNSINKFSPTDRMADLVRDDYRLLQVMTRFGISLGFGDKSVHEVCALHGVDTATFLTVANFMQEEDELVHSDVQSLSIPTMMNYLKRAHSYYLDFCLPTIRRKLVEAIDCTADNQVAFLILRFFDEYVAEISEHMEFENSHEFHYVNHLMAGDVEAAERITHEACPMKVLVKKNENGECLSVYHSGEHSNILLFTRPVTAHFERIILSFLFYLCNPSKIISHFFPLSTIILGIFSLISNNTKRKSITKQREICEKKS
jgi:hypothetical protein